MTSINHHQVMQGEREMTAAQTTISAKGSQRLAGLLVASSAGVILAVAAIAISARPVAEPATGAGAGAAVAPKVAAPAFHDRHRTMPQSTQAADAYLQSIADHHYLGIGYSDDAAASASVPAVPLTGPEQADKYIQSLLDKHDQAVAAAAADAYLQSIADHHYLGIGYSDDAAASSSVPAVPLSSTEQADRYIQSLLDKHAQGVAAAAADAADAYLQSIADHHYLGIGYSDDAAASASVPAVPLTGPEQADKYIQSLLDKRAGR